MAQLLTQMLKRDAADLTMEQTVELFQHLVNTLSPQVFTVLPPDWGKDAERLVRTGHLSLTPTRRR